jgi:hypothetical protein
MRVLIGKNSRGQWVAQQQDGLFGGLFVHRVDAVRYALFENGQHAEAITDVSGIIELDMAQRHVLPFAIAIDHPQSRAA